MFDDFLDLKKRIISILGEDITGEIHLVNTIIEVNYVYMNVMIRFSEENIPKNLKPKNNDLLMFQLYFFPENVEVLKTTSFSEESRFLDIFPYRIKIQLGKFVYSYDTLKKIAFGRFRLENYLEMADDNWPML